MKEITYAFEYDDELEICGHAVDYEDNSEISVDENGNRFVFYYVDCERTLTVRESTGDGDIYRNTYQLFYTSGGGYNSTNDLIFNDDQGGDVGHILAMPGCTEFIEANPLKITAFDIMKEKYSLVLDTDSLDTDSKEENE